MTVGLKLCGGSPPCTREDTNHLGSVTARRESTDVAVHLWIPTLHSRCRSSLKFRHCEEHSDAAIHRLVSRHLSAQQSTSAGRRSLGQLPYETTSAYKSRHCGFISTIKSILRCLDPFFSCFSRMIALCMFGCTSYQTRLWMP